MPAPSGPIYASTLHRRDRAWRSRRRRAARMRLMLYSGVLATLVALVIQRLV
jgi:hypothetical protein